MNTFNNKRRRESQEKIEQAFMKLLQTHEINNIKVSDIVKMTGVNRSTFYANYVDVYDLADKVKERLIQESISRFEKYNFAESDIGILNVFRHVKEDPAFYIIYFKLSSDDKHNITFHNPDNVEQYQLVGDINYHIELFRCGLNSVIKLWIKNGLKESPEEMVQILKSHYKVTI